MSESVAVSLLAANAAPFQRAVTSYLARRLGLALRFAGELPFAERQALLVSGEAALGFLCGLPYTQLADRPAPPIELLAAPVMAEARYRGQPHYFSDVIVRAGSRFQRFDELRGARWAFNEPGSFSGYAVTRWQLASLGERGGFFGSLVETGAHQASIRAVAEGHADASAIDSIVLAYELAQQPELALQLRSVAALGPSPVPPVVASTRLPAPARAALRAALLTMHEDEQGRQVLAQGQLARFALVRDADYDDLRRKVRAGEGIPLV
jgi:phosphonate transport system substrate-binding protein